MTILHRTEYHQSVLVPLNDTVNQITQSVESHDVKVTGRFTCYHRRFGTGTGTGTVPVHAGTTGGGGTGPVPPVPVSVAGAGASSPLIYNERRGRERGEGEGGGRLIPVKAKYLLAALSGLLYHARGAHHFSCRFSCLRLHRHGLRRAFTHASLAFLRLKERGNDNTHDASQ